MPPVTRHQRVADPLEIIVQTRFTRAQADALRAIADEYDWRAPSTLVRSIVGTWLIQREQLKGQALHDAVDALRALEDDD